jgi:WD40 repeat protein
MKFSPLFGILLVVLPTWPAGADQAPGLLPAGAVDPDPVLRLEGGGPLGPISAVAFGRAGTTLYEAGWDKVVRVWKRDKTTGRFQLDAGATLRVPIGPGDAGMLNALAVSSDGNWLATGGNAVLPEGEGFRQEGLILPRSSVADPTSQGIIYVFDLRTNPPLCRPLRGHRGPVQALTFAATPAGQPPLLLSAGAERLEPPAGLSLVLRFWQIPEGKELGRTTAGQYQALRPWLAAWPVAPGSTRYRAAVAWTSDSFLVWDVGAASRLIPDPHKGRSLVLSYLPKRATLLTGHFGELPRAKFPEGFVTAWNAAALTPDASERIAWRPDRSNVKAIPIAQALVSSRPGAGAGDLLALVLQSWVPPTGAGASGAFEYQLQLLELSPAGVGKVLREIPLWRGPRVQPLVAAAPDGTRLAIVGNPGNEVLVHAVDDLLGGRVEPERLGGKGEPIASATFVRKDRDQWGLRIERPGREPLILDAANRRFLPPSNDWLPAAAAPGDWRTVPDLRIRPEAESSRPTDVQVTARALLQPIPGGRLGTPIAAVALFEPGVGPTLWLHDARSGQRVRRLTGHTGPIRSLAFSDDGRLLVSAAEDRTVCLWSLIDLDAILRARGALPGLVLTRQDEGRYLVSEVRSDSPYAGQVDLRAGDVVTGFVEGGPGPGQTRLHVPRSVIEFHYTAASLKPGQTVTLRRLRGRANTRDLMLTLGQAVDGRLPLATLFLAQAEHDEWLVWHPSGFYDASGAGIAALFGWHFNQPGQPEAPARFALATEYPVFHRAGLLRGLFQDARITAPAPPPPPPPLRGELFLEPRGRPKGPDRLLVPQPPARLGLALDEPVPPPDRIESVTWQLDDRPPQEMQPAGTFWTAELSKVAWDRAPHRLAVTLQTRDPAQRLEKVLNLVYVPQPRLVPREVPRDKSGAPTITTSVQDRRFHLAFDVEPARDVSVRVSLVHSHGNDIVETPHGPYKAAQPLDVTLDLKPGANTIELTAINEGAADDLKDDQTARFGPLTVYYDPRPVERPEITLASLVLVPEEPGAGPRSRTIEHDEMDLGDVSVPRVRLEGSIKAKDPRDRLVSGRWKYADQGWKPLDGFPPQPHQPETPFHLELTLNPERRKIEIQASASNDAGEEKPETRSWWIEYRPPVPDLLHLAVDPPGPVIRNGTLGAAPEVKLTARIIGTPERFPLDRVDVLLDGELLSTAVPPAIDRKPGSRDGALTAVVPLRRGGNPISVRLRNRWHWKDFGPVTVAYLCRPKIEKLAVNVRDGQAVADVTARVASPGRPGVNVQVVGPTGTAALARAVDVVQEGQGQAQAWAVRAEVPLETGENAVRVHVWNEDGDAPEELPRSLSYSPPKPVEPKPRIIVDPDARTRRPVFLLRFRLESASPLERLSLFRERSARELVPVPEFTLGTVRKGEDGTFEYPVPLEGGPNLFTLEASNAGGPAATHLVLTYTPPPVRVKIQGIEPRPGDHRLFELETRDEGLPFVRQPLPEADVALQGWVVREPSYEFGAEPRIQVWVNGFPQVEVLLGPADREHPLQRPFRARILLGRKENTIDVRLNGAPLDIQGDRSFLATCQEGAKLPRQRLHLWVIGVGVEDARTLRERALAAINGRGYTQGATESFGTFETPAFVSGFFYGPDCKDLRRPRLYGTLLRIREQLGLNPQPSNDVVMIYYQGGEVIAGAEQQLCLRLRPGTGQSRDDLFPLSEIRRSLGETRGAKLFLLDVTHASDKDQASLILSVSARWINDNPAFGLLRFAWPGQPDLTATDVPPDRNLATALAAAVRRFVTLGEVDRAVHTQFPELYRPELHPSFNALIVGGP